MLHIKFILSIIVSPNIFFLFDNLSKAFSILSLNSLVFALEGTYFNLF